ncbi:heme exporter protein CcmD [Yoonia sp. 208BN28-4]
MPDLGKYAFEVLLAYGASLSLLGVLVLYCVVRSRRAKAALAKVERHG